MTKSAYAPIENIGKYFDELRWQEITKAMKLASERYDSPLGELTERQIIEVFMDACGLEIDDIHHELMVYMTLGHDRDTAMNISIHTCLIKKLRKP